MRAKLRLVRMLPRVTMLAWAVVLTACASARPSWTTRPPRGYAHDFFTGSGVGEDRASARSAAVSAAVARLAEGGRLSVQVVRRDSSVATERFTNGRSLSLDRTDKLVQEIVTTGQSATVRGLRLHEEYAEQRAGQYESWVLMALPRTTAVREPPSHAQLTLRSAIIPGWGQYTRGSTRKGFALAFGVAASIPAAIAFTSLRSGNEARAESAAIQANRESYTRQANQYRTLATVTIASTVAMWGYGIVDAASSPIQLYVSGESARSLVGLSVAFAGR